MFRNQCEQTAHVQKCTTKAFVEKIRMDSHSGKPGSTV
jgi:hypothetical protein